MDGIAIYIHFIGLNTQLLCQAENPILGRSHIRSTNIYITDVLILSKEITQESKALCETPPCKYLELGRIIS